MPWKYEAIELQRVRFIQAVLEKGESVKAGSVRFGISRKTAHKWLNRYHQEGSEGLRDRSHKPKEQGRCLEARWIDHLILLRRQHPTWGAKKFIPLFPSGACRLRTLERWLQRLGLTARRCRRARLGPALKPHRLTLPQRPNDVWTMDFKGCFFTGDGRRCDLLTIRDLYSRFGLGICLVSSLQEKEVRRICLSLFKRFGLPRVIRVDNGSPFAGTGPYGLSSLSLWWRRLGIHVEMTRPGCPQDNGSHEQFHRVYKAETLQPPAGSRRSQQSRSTRWLNQYNFHRPHQALGNRFPASFYRTSRRRYRPVPVDPHYPKNWKKLKASAKGYIRWQGRIRLLSRIVSGLHIGLKPLGRDCAHVYIDRILIGSLYAKDLAGMRPAHWISPKKV